MHLPAQMMAWTVRILLMCMWQQRLVLVAQGLLARVLALVLMLLMASRMLQTLAPAPLML
jgi:hypothetical protein